MMPRRVQYALWLAFFCHGLFILTARYRLSYDAFTHMLFANHYAEHWFSLWEPRWYTGFTVVSYPPLVHQLIASLIPLLGFEKAYALILWLVTTLYPLGIYAFSRIFTGRTSSSYAALASAILLPIYVTAHIFGQLPFLASTLLALFGAASLDRTLREGGLHNFLLTVSLYTTAMAAHHATLLVQPFWIFAVIAKNLFPSEASSVRISRFLGVSVSPRLILRLIVLALVTSGASLLVIWPFWQWVAGQAMQTPIDHLSRHNFLADPLALAIFFFPLYGPLVVFIPMLIRTWPRRFIGLLVSFAVLFLLGLGDTTPLPQLFFGHSWEWLTYDRFAFWAGLTMMPFVGILFIGMKRRFRFRFKPMQGTVRKNLLPALTFSLFAVTSLGSWFTPYLFQLQPEPINMKPIVDFLGADDHSQYRYLTFGFGDQFAYLNLLTQATTIDGSYHTARTLPELRESGIGQIDTVYWALKGIPAIGPILQRSGEHGVRWGFVNRKEFIPELRKDGWKYLKTLSNHIQVWENPDALLPEPTQRRGDDPFTAFSWGVFPMLSFITTLSLGGLRVYPVETRRIIQWTYSFVIGLIPISLCFWMYKVIAEYPNRRVYFTYTDALFFLSDGLVLLAIILWISVKIAHRSNQDSRQRFFSLSSKLTPQRQVQRFILQPSFILLLLLCLFLLSSFSALWSRDWRVSLSESLHFWLMFLLILSLRDWPQVWRIALFGFCAALSIEIIAGCAGFALQSTAFLVTPDMKWPGLLLPSMHGASVVELTNGLRFLRAYGTMPHPNILGGFTLLALLGTASLFLLSRKPNYPALLLFSLGMILLALTFSRSAWLGFLGFVGVLVFKRNYFEPRRLFLLLATSVLTVFLTLLPLHSLVFVRVSNPPIATEQLSTFGRSWLNQQAFDMFRTQPFTGVGLGSFILQLASYRIEGATVEPVHSIFFLAASELGIFGFLLVAGLFVVIAWNIFKARSTNAILASASVTGLGVVSLFDHYLWTLPPGRVMLALALGLWLGQITHDA